MRTHFVSESSCRSVFLLLGLFAAMYPGPVFGQTATNPSPWLAWQFLLGEWSGEGGGQPGQGVGTFAFRTDLQGAVLVRSNHSDFPASEGRPAYSHDDLTVIYPEPGKPTKAVYFDNEGHVIHYTTEFSPDSNAVVFLSEPTPGAPRFRLTYEKKKEGLVEIRFDIAPPGKPESFTQYIKADAHRK